MSRIGCLSILIIGLSIAPLSVPAQESSTRVNLSIGAGTFAAGENVGGSVFLGGSLSADWIPDARIGLSYGLESGLLGGKTQGSIIYGVPVVFRLGWHPSFIRVKNLDLYVVARIGWAFGIWGSNIDDASSPNGMVGGLDFVGIWFLSPVVGIFAEIGYTYYGLARSSKHPEYPLGYGSGKLYSSLGLSFRF
jgi:hypothetical protein